MAGDVQINSDREGAVSSVPGPQIRAANSERPGRRRPLPLRRAVAITAVLAGVVGLAAACSSPKSPAAGKSPSGVAAKALAYSKCMRRHGISDYPDPTISSNGGHTGVGIKIGAHAGSSSDLNPKNPRYQAASRACQSRQPGGQQGPASAQELAADVKFAACMRSHGFPAWPDPDGHGVFNLTGAINGAINTNSAQFGSASKTCESKTHVHGLSINQNSRGGGS